MKLPQRPSSGSGLEWRYASERHTTRREQLLLDGQATWIGTASHWLWTLTRNKLEVSSAFWNGSRFIVIDIHDNPTIREIRFHAGPAIPLASPDGDAPHPNGASGRQDESSSGGS